jgi:predicted O-methyltransferase YrrM
MGELRVSNLQEVMRELEARDCAERAAGLPSAQRMRALVPEAGQFISIIIRAGGMRRILEIGTSHGYSTLWLASAAQAIGGHVDTLELSPERFAAAREHFQRAGLSDAITQQQGDAKQLLLNMEGPYEFIFIDAEKDDYEDYLDLTLGKAAQGGIIMADNVLSHADQLGHYVEKAQHTAGLLSVTVPVGRGEEMGLRVAQGLPSELVATLAALEVHGRTHSNTWNVSRAAGKFLYILAVAARAKNVVELGTSTGYSGVWLAAAMAETGGRVLTIDSDPAKIKHANESFAQARVSPYINTASGKSLDVLPAVPGPFDFAFIDAEKEEYLAYVEALWPKLTPGALIVADNIDSHPETLAAYAAHMQARSDALSVTLHIGSGMELSMKR